MGSLAVAYEHDQGSLLACKHRAHLATAVILYCTAGFGHVWLIPLFKTFPIEKEVENHL